MRARPAPTHLPDDAEKGFSRTFSIAGNVMTARKPAPGLYLVATPIGNLGDITVRALEILAGVDIVACEDTRVSRKLLDRFCITATLKPYHEHNAAAARPKIIEKLSQGASIALISDAGTPLISDPGFKLVREVHAAGFAVIALPGPSSVLAALSVSGLPTDRFFFEGFLPSKENARQTRLAELARFDSTLVMFESGTRVQNTLRDLASVMGEREAAICREMTKLHEEIKRGRITDLAASADELETRGEFVLVVGPPAAGAGVMSQDELDQFLTAALARGSVKDAVSEALEISGLPRREIYARALALAENPDRATQDSDGDS